MSLRNQIVFVCLIAALWAPSLRAEAQDSCTSSKAATDLISCDHCHDLKQLLAQIGGTKLSIEVYDVAQGVLIQLVDIKSTAKIAVVNLTGEIWALSNEPGTAKTASYCDVCTLRNRKLQLVERDRALTPEGVIVILTGSDPATLAWLREDARIQQRLLERAVASN